MPKYNIAIIGAGPVGSIMAAYLARNGENVSLVDTKEELITAIQQDGITLKEKENSFQVKMKNALFSTAELRSLNIDLFFISVKFNYMDTLLDEIKPIFRPGQKIIIVQNGIDNEELAAEKLSKNDVLRFVINYAGMHEKPGTVKMSFFNPPNYLGTIDPKNKEKAQSIAKMLTEAGLETAYTPEIKKHEWKKTILNAALMPVCATTGLTMKEAMSQEDTRWLCEQILAESIQVAAKLGFTYGESFFQNCVQYLSKAGHHKPSTSLDLEAGNPIEYIFQPIIDYGKKVGSPTPVLESLTRVMKTLENQKKNS
ncbi:MAG: 2-dehydropantoate 2-reductase [Candidatus Aminicenantes bacterium]|nr:2-dehydropantoate 2-reductase [Candidatus Aminicenantes bacterium]